MTHKLWPATTIERVLGYAYSAVLTLQITLLAVATTDFPQVTRAAEIATTLQVLLVPLLFDVIIHDLLLPAPQVRTLATGVGTAWNAALVVTWTVLATATGKRALFVSEAGVAWTLLAGYCIMTAILGWWTALAWLNPRDTRPQWRMSLQQQGKGD